MTLKWRLTVGWQRRTLADMTPRLRLATSKVLAMTAADLAGLEGTIQIKAYAGIDPTTGKPAYVYDQFTAGAGKREVTRICKDLDARALDLAEARRARRRDPHAERPKKRVKVQTVGEAVEVWWAKHGRQLASAPRVRSLIDNIIIPELGAYMVALTAGTPPDDDEDRDPDVVYLAEEWARIGWERGLAPQTIHRCHGMVGAALRRAGHPIPDPGLPPLVKGESQTPLVNEMAPFLDFLAEPREKPSVMDLIVEAMALLVHTGPRPVEALALTRDRIDRNGGRVSFNGDGVVMKRDDNDKVYWAVEHGETVKRRKRTIVLDPRTAAALNRWLRFQDEMALAAGVRLRSRALVFSLDFEAKEPMSPGGISAAFGRAVDRAEAAGLELPAGFHLYSMRHFGISQLLRAGRDVTAVAQRFGTSAQMIHSTYGEFIDKDDRHLADSLGELWVDRNGTVGDIVSLR